MDRSWLMAIVLALMVALLALLLLGWRARQKRQSGIAKPLAAPADLGTLVGEFSGKYVATTVHDDPLERIAVHGLGFRGSVTLTVTAEGLLARIAGAKDIWIPREAVRNVRRATWTIDRVVEPDGLQLVSWQLGDQTLDSYFRMDAPTDCGAAIQTLRQAA